MKLCIEVERLVGGQLRNIVEAAGGLRYPEHCRLVDEHDGTNFARKPEVLERGEAVSAEGMPRAPGEVLHSPSLQREDLGGDGDKLQQVGEHGHGVDVVATEGLKKTSVSSLGVEAPRLELLLWGTPPQSFGAGAEEDTEILTGFADEKLGEPWIEGLDDVPPGLEDALVPQRHSHGLA
mgnify:CR=1 FL=1